MKTKEEVKDDGAPAPKKSRIRLIVFIAAVLSFASLLTFFIPWLSVLAGLIVFALGIYFYRILRKLTKWEEENGKTPKWPLNGPNIDRSVSLAAAGIFLAVGVVPLMNYMTNLYGVSLEGKEDTSFNGEKLAEGARVPVGGTVTKAPNGVIVTDEKDLPRYVAPTSTTTISPDVDAPGIEDDGRVEVDKDGFTFFLQVARPEFIYVDNYVTDVYRVPENRDKYIYEVVDGLTDDQLDEICRISSWFQNSVDGNAGAGFLFDIVTPSGEVVRYKDSKHPIC